MSLTSRTWSSEKCRWQWFNLVSWLHHFFSCYFIKLECYKLTTELLLLPLQNSVTNNDTWNALKTSIKWLSFVVKMIHRNCHSKKSFLAAILITFHIENCCQNQTTHTHPPVNQLDVTPFCMTLFTVWCLVLMLHVSLQGFSESARASYNQRRRCVLVVRTVGILLSYPYLGWQKMAAPAE